MGFEFKSDQEPKQMVDTKTTLSVNETRGFTDVRLDLPIASDSDEPTIVEENLEQIIYSEGEEGELAIQFLEECGLYQKFLLWQGIQEQLKNLKLSLETPTE
jgi:hypothetical protein